jgi:hypothetical protein
MATDWITDAVSSGATTLASAMATDAWGKVKEGFSHLFGRGDPDREKLAAERLEQGMIALTEADLAEIPRVRDDIASAWEVRLKDLIMEYPDAAYGLRDLLAQVAPLIPSESKSWTQVNVAQDHGSVYAVQTGRQNVQRK